MLVGKIISDADQCEQRQDKHVRVDGGGRGQVHDQDADRGQRNQAHLGGQAVAAKFLGTKRRAQPFRNAVQQGGHGAGPQHQPARVAERDHRDHQKIVDHLAVAHHHLLRPGLLQPRRYQHERDGQQDEVQGHEKEFQPQPAKMLVGKIISDADQSEQRQDKHVRVDARSRGQVHDQGADRDQRNQAG